MDGRAVSLPLIERSINPFPLPVACLHWRGSFLNKQPVPATPHELHLQKIRRGAGRGRCQLRRACPGNCSRARSLDVAFPARREGGGSRNADARRHAGSEKTRLLSANLRPAAPADSVARNACAEADSRAAQTARDRHAATCRASITGAGKAPQDSNSTARNPRAG